MCVREEEEERRREEGIQIHRDTHTDTQTHTHSEGLKGPICVLNARLYGYTSAHPSICVSGSTTSSSPRSSPVSESTFPCSFVSSTTAAKKQHNHRGFVYM